MESGQRFYNDDEAEQILRMAVSDSLGHGQVSRDHLLQSARELGISEEALANAEAKWSQQQISRSEYEQFRKAQKSGYWSHLLAFLLVNGFLFAINILTDSGHLWFLYPLLGWGLGLAFHTVATFARGTGMHEEAYQDWLRERDRKGTSIRAHSGVTIGVHVSSRLQDRVRSTADPSDQETLGS